MLTRIFYVGCIVFTGFGLTMAAPHGYSVGGAAEVRAQATPSGGPSSGGSTSRSGSRYTFLGGYYGGK